LSAKLTISGISASSAPAGAGTPVKKEPVQAGGGVSATTIRRVHRGFGRLFYEEIQRRTAENLAAQLP
jgi:hypothetical protein